MQWIGDGTTGDSGTVTAVVLADGRRVAVLGCSSLDDNRGTLMARIEEMVAEIGEEELEYFEPTVPSLVKFEQRRHDRHRANVEHMRSLRLANNHFIKRSKFRKLGRKKIRRS